MSRLADHCNRDVDALWSEAHTRMQAALRRPRPPERPVDLDAHVRVVHGGEVVADSAGSLEAMWARFGEWVQRHYPRT